MMMKKDKPNVMPGHVLHSIGEYADGFLLFHLNESGIPIVNQQCHSISQMLALQSYVSLWLDTQKTLQTQNLLNQFKQLSNEDEEENNNTA